jgi:hypothetical protein
MINKSTIITSISVFLLYILINLDYLSNKDTGIQERQAIDLVNDSLQLVNQKLMAENLKLKEGDSLRVRSVYNNYYDAYDDNNYRLYALYKSPKNKKLSLKKLARRFNIDNPKSIKVSSVLNDDWFIVPVKGVHFVREGERLEQLSKFYYFNANDSKLLTDFNGEIKTNKMIIIPFN